ncbi:hypothetical protein T492DRAFT_1065737 [Pavlovales sp. CCMP2436]|nr:hypothetical protein T492DRAFT_1065737 [Pavlovales sp. CCMP2436]
MLFAAAALPTDLARSCFIARPKHEDRSPAKAPRTLDTNRMPSSSVAEPERDWPPTPILVAADPERDWPPTPILIVADPERVWSPAPILGAADPERIWSPTPILVAAALPSAEAYATSALAFADDDADLQSALLASMMESSPGAEGDWERPDPFSLNPSSPLFAQFERPPLVGPTERLDERVASGLRANDAGVSALGRLGEQGAHLVRIRGDGHCMFRGLAAGLVLAAREMTPAQARAVGAFLAQRLPRPPPLQRPVAFGSDSIASVSSSLDLLGCLHDGTLPSCAPEAVSAALAEPASSDELVAAMRRAACEHMRVHTSRFRECEAALGSSFEQYCSEMEPLVPPDGAPRYGGAIELVAFSELLECAVDVYDVEALRTESGALVISPSYQFQFSDAAAAVGEADLPMDGVDESLQSWVVLEPQPTAGEPLLRALRLTLLRTGLHYHLLTGVAWARPAGSLF